MAEQTISLRYQIDGDNFTTAGQASSDLKKVLKQLGVLPEIIRKAAISMYEGEINTIIHGKGGEAEVTISSGDICIVFRDKGPGIPDIEKAMQAGFSTASNEARELGFGAGMGLPNMQKYSDDMKIESTVGVGTTVTLVIKLA